MLECARKIVARKIVACQIVAQKIVARTKMSPYTYFWQFWQFWSRLIPIRPFLRLKLELPVGLGGANWQPQF
jgi:hypothetical protein